MVGAKRAATPWRDHSIPRAMANFKPLPPLEELQQAFEYDPKTGLFTHKLRPSPRVKIGQVAGSLNRHGYIQIRFNYYSYLAHRLAWKMHYGVDPKDLIDHKNRKRTDNRIANLREATALDNRLNQESKGYQERHGKFAARINKGKSYCWIGTFDTPEEARAAYLTEMHKHLRKQST